jgi:histidine triad (HIT) family protein
MSLSGAYDPNNIFARILRGEIPCHTVYEDDQTLAILDAFPQSRGHTLVIPKVAARTLFDISPAALETLMTCVQHVAKGVRAALNPDGVLIQQFNGADAGQTVFHLHVHVIPRYAGVPLGEHSGGMADATVLRSLAAQIAAHIPPLR